MPIEVEIKLIIPDELTADRLSSDPVTLEYLMEDFKDVKMNAVYYDTPSNDLMERKWSLRLRKEDAVEIVTFKMDETRDGALFTREEWQCPGKDLNSAIPLLIDSGAPAELSDFSGYTERCRMVFNRRKAAIKLKDESIAEMAIDEGMIYAGAKSVKFHELELELLAGNPDSLVSLSQEWMEKYGLTKEFNSKYARALRLIRSR